MTKAERALMQQHAAYWRDLASKGTALVFGPVADPSGVWGVGIVEVENEGDVRSLVTNDPTMKLGTNFKCEIYPMPAVVLRGGVHKSLK
jgi:uncharacterized protein YciI